jgi:hypothetical protein
VFIPATDEQEKVWDFLNCHILRAVVQESGLYGVLVTGATGTGKTALLRGVAEDIIPQIPGYAPNPWDPPSSKKKQYAKRGLMTHYESLTGHDLRTKDSNIMNPFEYSYNGENISSLPKILVLDVNFCYAMQDTPGYATSFFHEIFVKLENLAQKAPVVFVLAMQDDSETFLEKTSTWFLESPDEVTKKKEAVSSHPQRIPAGFSLKKWSQTSTVKDILSQYFVEFHLGRESQRPVSWGVICKK